MSVYTGTAIQKCGVGRNIKKKMFWKKYLLLTKAAFIYSKQENKTKKHIKNSTIYW